jgi:lysophospholipase L1-like esterase
MVLLAAAIGCGVASPLEVCAARAPVTASSASAFEGARQGPASTSATASVSASVYASSDPSAPSASASASAFASASAVASASGSSVPTRRKIAIGKGTKIALVGDSMVHAGLSQAFEKRINDAGGIFLHDSWASSKLRDWVESMRLPNLMFAKRPDAVFIVIGTNEVHYKAPHMAEDVRALVARLGTTPCVLLGPPVWDYQAGIVDALRDNAGHCAFVDATNLKIRRQKDGIHPSLEGGKAWTDAIFAETVQ